VRVCVSGQSCFQYNRQGGCFPRQKSTGVMSAGTSWMEGIRCDGAAGRLLSQLANKYYAQSTQEDERQHEGNLQHHVASAEDSESQLSQEEEEEEEEGNHGHQDEQADDMLQVKLISYASFLFFFSESLDSCLDVFGVVCTTAVKVMNFPATDIIRLLRHMGQPR
jgi:hypothetical protein